MKFLDIIKIIVKDPTKCVSGLSEDDLRSLADSLGLEATNKDLEGFVISTAGIQVKFVFGSDGSFQGVFAKINGQNVNLIPGASSSNLGIFKGVPSNTNPGLGWKVEDELTRTYLNQPLNQNQWDIFFASRVSVINTFNN